MGAELMSGTWTRGVPALAVAVVLPVLGGCASQPKTPPLYGWDGYDAAVYQTLKAGPDADPQGQISTLEAGEEKIRAEGKELPPGFRAMLGMLYAQVGQVDKAQASFAAEKASFPEATQFMDFLQPKHKDKAR